MNAIKELGLKDLFQSVEIVNDLGMLVRRSLCFVGPKQMNLFVFMSVPCT